MTAKVRSWPWWVLLDVVLVVIFAALGRRSHEHSLSVAGIAETAAPFVLAYLAMTLISRPWLTINRIWPTGVLVWGGTVALGIALRLAFGATAAVPFIIVAAVVLGVFLIGRRLLTRLLTRSSAEQH